MGKILHYLFLVGSCRRSNTALPFPTSPSGASFAHTLLLCIALVYEKVIAKQWVSVLAVRFKGVGPTGHVLGMSDRFQMGRIGTQRISAQVIEFQVRWPQTNKQFVKQFVCINLASLVSYLSIPTSISIGSPLPTRRGIIKSFSRNLDFIKNSAQQFAVTYESARIAVSHDSFTSHVKKLWSGLHSVFQAPMRPALIIPNFFNNAQHFAAMREVCYR